jgi:DnaD/phage-associated family protein
MARGRMINKKICNSRVVNDLPLPVQLLYTWLIPHLDCNGCFYGSAQMIKSLVFPRKNYTKKLIEVWLELLEKSVGTEKNPLIVRYFVNSEQYLFMPGFVGEQIGLRRDKKKPEFPTFDGKDTESIGQIIPPSRTEVEGEIEVEVEGKEKTKQKESSVRFLQSIETVKTLYQDNILLGATIPEDMENELKGACNRYSPDWVYDAIREALIQNHQDWGYIVGILRKWSKYGRKLG